jgi:hypothetical protein
VTRPDSTYPITFKPYKFDISQYGDKPRTKLSFEVTNLSDEDLELTLVDTPDEMFKIDLPNKISAGKTAKGEITINDKYVKDEFEKSITVEVSDAEHSRFTIPVKRVIRIPGETSETATSSAHTTGSGH